ncbi:RNA polymerase subunit sigma-24 [bacterium]|nr:RNA polymerase subunit sigma-24 [bacterium]MBU3930623.1 RNA polymerase subunit sigma-24 [bacterium]
MRKNNIFKFVSICVVFIGAIFLTIKNSTYIFNKGIHYIAGNRGNISEKKANKLEEQLLSNPGDLNVREKLLKYYFRHSKSESSRKKKQEHVRWLINNHPESEIAGHPYAELNPILDKSAYSDAKQLWLKQVESNKSNVKILMNAVNFFTLFDKDLCIKILKDVQRITPNDDEAYRKLGHIYSLEIRSSHGKSRKKIAKQALDEYEKAMKLTDNNFKRSFVLTEVAKVAFESGEYDKAELFALELLSNKHNWDLGEAVHHGNLILGRIELKRGEVEKAKEYLINAGKTKGSASLNSFGPNMALAKELLDKGEQEVVLEYFKLCSKFWYDRRGKLKEWSKEIKSGKLPDFGANLYY